MILDHISAPALREGWTTEQDSLLLIGIRNLGLWNWHGIEKFIRAKCVDECEAHYLATFLDSESAPLPPAELLPVLRPHSLFLYDRLRAIRDGRSAMSSI
jgi:hypothetical protein